MKDAILFYNDNSKEIYRDGDKCIKVFDTNYSKEDVLNEALNQARVENLGLNTAKLFEVKMIDGKWAIVFDYIEGKTLQQLMDENPKKTEEYLRIYLPFSGENIYGGVLFEKNK